MKLAPQKLRGSPNVMLHRRYTRGCSRICPPVSENTRGSPAQAKPVAQDPWAFFVFLRVIHMGRRGSHMGGSWFGSHGLTLPLCRDESVGASNLRSSVPKKAQHLPRNTRRVAIATYQSWVPIRSLTRVPSQKYPQTCYRPSEFRLSPE